MFILLVVLVLAPRPLAVGRRVRVDATPRSRAGRGRAAQASARARRAVRRVSAILLADRAPAPAVRGPPEPAHRLLDGPHLPDGRGVGDRAHRLGGAAVARAVRVRRHRRVPHRVLRAVDSDSSRRSRSASLWGVGDRHRHRHSRACACAASISAIITLGFALVVSGYLILQDRVQQLVHRIRSRRAADPHIPTVGTVGLRDRQAGVLLLLLRRRCSS